MDYLMLILTAIGTTATVVSAVITVKAKNEAKDILKQIKEEKSRNIRNSGDVRVTNSGNNSGVLSGINSGDIQNDKKRV